MTKISELTRPIVGMENRTAQEVFDIMADRFRQLDKEQEGGHIQPSVSPVVDERVRVLLEAVKPFAVFDTADGDGFDDELFRMPDGHPLLGKGLGDNWKPAVTIGDFRRLRAAATSLEQRLRDAGVNTDA